MLILLVNRALLTDATVNAYRIASLKDRGESKMYWRNWLVLTYPDDASASEMELFKKLAEEKADLVVQQGAVDDVVLASRNMEASPMVTSTVMEHAVSFSDLCKAYDYLDQPNDIITELDNHTPKMDQHIMYASCVQELFSTSLNVLDPKIQRIKVEL
ncbi:hypothetical protein VPHK397_0162 [Vibrio phage K397]|nr:hypothetical protein MYOV002v2_p0153 [Vibrio phage 144E46.1]